MTDDCHDGVAKARTVAVKVRRDPKRALDAFWGQVSHHRERRLHALQKSRKGPFVAPTESADDPRRSKHDGGFFSWRHRRLGEGFGTVGLSNCHLVLWTGDLQRMNERRRLQLETRSRPFMPTVNVWKVSMLKMCCNWATRLRCRIKYLRKLRPLKTLFPARANRVSWDWDSPSFRRIPFQV